MAPMTIDEARERWSDLIGLAEKRQVSLGHIEILDLYLWIEEVERRLGVLPGAPLPDA